MISKIAKVFLILILISGQFAIAEEVENAPPPSEETVVQETAPAETGGATMETGDAVASSDTVNIVNVNEVNSEGEVVAASGSLGDSSIDLRETLTTGNGNITGCEDCLIATTTIQNQNIATVTNSMSVEANTGNNAASSTGSINTGNAYAAANVVNVVNTNIVESNYTLLVFNNFGDWSGDLILPKGDFFSDFLSLFNSDCDCGFSQEVSNSNKAFLGNNVETLANTGENDASGGEINSGDSLSSSNVYNLVNTNIYKNSSFYLLVKVLGDWNGNIFNLPEGMDWMRTDEGLILFNKNEQEFLTSSGSSGNLQVENDNSALVQNDVKVSANTGANVTEGGEIKTGSAYAGSNTVNIINTNIIGSNWVAALINVFGNWNGNISFGQPDLWVAAVASIEGEAEGGSDVLFTVTVKNNGDAKASDVSVISSLKSGGFDFYQGDFNLFQLDSLFPGESKEFKFRGVVDRYAKGEDVVIETKISSTETDGNLKDNKDTLSFKTKFNQGAILLSQTSFGTSYPKLSVQKTHTLLNSTVIDGKAYASFGSSVDYKITVKNSGGLAQTATLFDELIDESGDVVNRQAWELGEIFPGEEIIVTYTTEFNGNSKPGKYTNYAWVEAQNIDDNEALQKDADSNVASSEITLAKKVTIETVPGDVENMSQGEVLGASAEIFDEVANQEEAIGEEDFYGLCLGSYDIYEADENQEESSGKGKMSIYESMLLGFSFVLITQRKKEDEDLILA